MSVSSSPADLALSGFLENVIKVIGEDRGVFSDKFVLYILVDDSPYTLMKMGFEIETTCPLFKPIML